MNSCGTRAKFLLVICRLKSLDTWTSSLSAVFTSSGDLKDWAAIVGAVNASTSPMDARAAKIFFVLFIFIPSMVLRLPSLRRYMQNPVHIFGMAWSGAEKRVVPGCRRDELGHHCIAFIAHRHERDDTRILCRNNTFRFLRVLVYRS